VHERREAGGNELLEVSGKIARPTRCIGQGITARVDEAGDAALRGRLSRIARRCRKIRIDGIVVVDPG